MESAQLRRAARGSPRCQPAEARQPPLCWPGSRHVPRGFPGAETLPTAQTRPGVGDTQPGCPATLTWLMRGWGPEDKQVSQAQQAVLPTRTRPSQLQRWQPARLPWTPGPGKLRSRQFGGGCPPSSAAASSAKVDGWNQSALSPGRRTNCTPRALGGGLLKRPPAPLSHLARSAALQRPRGGRLCPGRGDGCGFQSSVMPRDAGPPRDVPTAPSLRRVLPRGSSPPRPPPRAVVRPDT